MRTTIRLPDDVLRRAKARAAERGQSLTSFLEHAVRDALDTPEPRAHDYPPIPVSKETGWVRPGINMDKISELFMQEDIADGTFR